MDSVEIAKLAFLIFGMLLASFDIYHSRRNGMARISPWILGSVAAAFVLFNVYLWTNHIGFPLNLDLMEGVILQHFERAASFQAVYPQPTPEYVPLAYNPLYYVLAVPFGWIFGVNLFSLRLVAILGMAGSGVILYLIVRQETRSSWWGLMAVGIYAAAYRAMDAYLDTAHSDSWLLFSALLGSYLIYRNRSRTQNLLGVVLLVAAFWFKQHGALFALGGLAYLTWREGVKSALIYWATAALLGPLTYIFVGPQVFGPYFHYFTWTVPRGWSEVHRGTFLRYFTFVAGYYLVLAICAGLWTLWVLLKERKRLSIWQFQFIAAALSGLMGSLDPGSSDNVYIAMGMLTILCGTIALHEGTARIRVLQRYYIDQLALYVTLALLFFNPFSVIVSSQASARYSQLIAMLKSLDGPVYAPVLGQLEGEYKFYPAAHRVALEDMIRGPGKDMRDQPIVKQLLQPAAQPAGAAYILTNKPLGGGGMLSFLEERYVLDTDFGDQFKPLRVLPKRWDHGWPRYLYRYAPAEAVLEAAGTQP